MGKITFTKVTYKNFRSVGEAGVTIDLNTHKTTLISGANGSGKTTAIHALCFVLFGRGYGKITKPALINSINQKQLYVSVEFSIGPKQYKINRGIKPNVFEIFENNVLVNQDPSVKDYQKVLEQQILKFNYRAFTQVVVVGGGSDYSPFMTLSAKDRREFVEDLLDIRIFSTMNLIVKDKIKLLKDNLKMLEVDLKNKKEKLVMLESFIKKLKADSKVSIDEIQNKIKEVESQLQHNKSEQGAKLAKKNVLYEKISKYEEIDSILDEVRKQIRSSKTKLVDLDERKTVFTANTECPVCLQKIQEEHSDMVLQSFKKDMKGIADELTSLLEKKDALSNSLGSYESDMIEFRNVNDELTTLFNKELSLSGILQHLQEEIISVSVKSDVDSELQKMKILANEYITMSKQKKDTLNDLQLNEFIQVSLADSGIKSKIIKQYIPTINKLINKYLTEFDFFVSFHLDEHFTETIKSRHRDTFTYENFSEGQKRRIDMAILLTWMDIAKSKNALHTNIAFFDEIDSVLDKDGADMLHATLKACSSENIFIISHKADILADKVDNHIDFRIHNNFTEIVKN